MTTATDWDVRDSETNDRLTVTDVQARLTQLDGAATEAPVSAVEQWVPKTPAHITPAATCGTCGGPEYGRTKRTADSELPARTWARMSGAHEWPQIPDEALTAYGRAQAEYDSAHQQIQDLRDLAFWAETEQRKIVSEVSGEYWSRRAAVENRYDMEISRLHTDDDTAPYWAYVQALPAYVRGETHTVATEQHGSVYDELAPERLAVDAGPPHRQPPPPPPSSADSARVLAPLATEPEPNYDDKHGSPLWRGSIAGNWLRDYTGLIAGAAVGIAAAVALGVTIWLTGGP